MRLVIACLAAVALGGTAARVFAQDDATPGPVSAAVAAAEGRCGKCHPKERVQFETSRHAQENVGCVSCHGGDSGALTVAGAHGHGFTGKLSKPAILQMCGSCHSDEKKMRPYNLPVDQLALYQLSGHGVRLAKGDVRVAVCSDCHGAHDILSVTDTRSLSYPLNIARTCGKCHGDKTTAAGKDAKENVFDAYSSSVHAAALLNRGNSRAPTCTSCHGTHGAAPPAFGDVDKVCGGACHTEERRYFAAGPHREGLARQEEPECVSCHTAHAITPATPDRLNKLCVECHDQGSKEQQLGQKLYTEYMAASHEIDQAEAQAAKAEAVPINTDDYRARLEEARTYLSEALPAAHSVNQEIVLGYTARARSVGREVQTEIYAKLGQIGVNKLLLIVFWFYVGLTIVVVRRFRGSGS